MANTKIIDDFRSYTQKAGDISRQLGLAAIAIIWLIHTASVPTGGHALDVKIDGVFHIPIGLIVLSLLFDALQYLCGSAILAKAVLVDDQGSEEISEHKNKIAVMTVIILIKLIIMIIAYCFLLKELHKIFL